MKQFIEVIATPTTDVEHLTPSSVRTPDKFFINVIEIKAIRQGVIYTHSEPFSFNKQKYKDIKPVSRDYEKELGLK